MGLYPDPRPRPSRRPRSPAWSTPASSPPSATRVTDWSRRRPGDGHRGRRLLRRAGRHPRPPGAAGPGGLDLADAAAVPEVFLTAWDALVVQGGLDERALGARPRRRVRRRHGRHPDRQGDRRPRRRHLLGRQGRRLPRARRRPRARALAGRLARPRSTSALAERGGRDGVDVVLDVVGGDEVDRNLRAVRPQGTIVQVGLMGGGRADVNLGLLLDEARRAGSAPCCARRPLEEKIADQPALRRRGAAAVRRPARCDPVDRPPLPARPTSPTPTGVMEADANVGKILLDVAARVDGAAAPRRPARAAGCDQRRRARRRSAPRRPRVERGDDAARSARPAGRAPTPARRSAGTPTSWRTARRQRPHPRRHGRARPTTGSQPRRRRSCATTRRRADRARRGYMRNVASVRLGVQLGCARRQRASSMSSVRLGPHRRDAAWPPARVVRRPVDGQHGPERDVGADRSAEHGERRRSPSARRRWQQRWPARAGARRRATAAPTPRRPAPRSIAAAEPVEQLRARAHVGVEEHERRRGGRRRPRASRRAACRPIRAGSSGAATTATPKPAATAAVVVGRVVVDRPRSSSPGRSWATSGGSRSAERAASSRAGTIDGEAAAGPAAGGSGAGRPQQQPARATTDGEQRPTRSPPDARTAPRPRRVPADSAAVRDVA